MFDREPPEKFYNKARAKIIWGEPVYKVEAWLKSNDLPDKEIRQTIRDSLAERSAAIKQKGLGYTFKGSLYALGSILLIYLILDSGAVPLKFTGFIGIVTMYGFYKLAVGQYYFFNSGTAKGSIHDL